MAAKKNSDAAALDAALQQHVGLAPGHLLSGVQLESPPQNPSKPYKSVVRTRHDGFSLGTERHATKEEATLRVLRAAERFYAAPPPGSTAVAGQFMLAQHKHVDARDSCTYPTYRARTMSYATSPVPAEIER